VAASPAPLARLGGLTLTATGPEPLPDDVLGARLLLLAVALARRRTRVS
jgi:hypothetical protein